MSEPAPETWGGGCECWVTPESQWFTYGSAVEPGSQIECNPRCPKHGEPERPLLVRPVPRPGRQPFWSFTCRDCAPGKGTGIFGYLTPAEAADAGREHHHRAHGCCSLHTATCGLQDWCCEQCSYLARARAYADGEAQ